MPLTWLLVWGFLSPVCLFLSLVKVTGLSPVGLPRPSHSVVAAFSGSCLPCEVGLVLGRYHLVRFGETAARAQRAVVAGVRLGGPGGPTGNIKSPDGLN